MLATTQVFAQREIDAPLISGERGHTNSIYLSFDPNSGIMKWKEGNDSKDDAGTLKNNDIIYYRNISSCNIHFQWYNPLIFGVKFEQTTSDDNRDKAINDFVNLLGTSFGISSPEATQEASASSLKAVEENIKSEQREKYHDYKISTLQKPKKANVVAIQDTVISPDATNLKELLGWEIGFKTFDINLLYVHLLENELKIQSAIDSVNKLTQLIHKGEEFDLRNIQKELSNALSTLSSQLLRDDAVENTKTIKEKLKELESQIKGHESNLQVMSKLASNLNLNDVPLDNILTLTVEQFISDKQNSLDNGKLLIEKFNSVIELMENSFTNQSARANDFQQRSEIQFQEGKVKELTIVIYQRKYEFPESGLRIVSDTSIIKRTITFKRHEPITPIVGTGVFYTNTTIRGYGVSNSSPGVFTVTQDDLKSNSPGTALFLNFPIFTGSRYLEPMLQFGIDPTKKRPFLLIGGGMGIPSSKFAITFGGIWTWAPTLDKLSVGETITSTTELEKDISYKFNAVPKGYYLGIEFNLGKVKE